MQEERVPQDVEVLVDGRPRDLGVARHGGEVDDRRVAGGGDPEEPAEGRDVAGRPLGQDLLLEVGARVGLEVRAGVVGEVDRRQEPPGDRTAQVEPRRRARDRSAGAADASARALPAGSRRPRRSFRALEPVRRNRVPRSSMRRWTSFRISGSRWTSSMTTSRSRGASSSASRPGRWLSARYTRAVEEVVDAGLRQLVAEERALAGLARTEEEVRLFREPRRQVRSAIDVRNRLRHLSRHLCCQ